VAQELLDRRLVAARSLLDQPFLEGPVEVEHGAVFERLVADQDGSFLSTFLATMSTGQPT
jgi:hypothetical protein